MARSLAKGGGIAEFRSQSGASGVDLSQAEDRLSRRDTHQWRFVREAVLLQCRLGRASPIAKHEQAEGCPPASDRLVVSQQLPQTRQV